MDARLKDCTTVAELRASVRRFTRSLGALGPRSSVELVVVTPSFPREDRVRKLADALGVPYADVSIDTSAACESCGADTRIRICIAHFDLESEG